MPISLSSRKALRVTRRKTSLNRHRKRLIGRALKTVSAGNLNQAVSFVDKAAKWRIIHPNKAARLKSRLMKQFPAAPKSPKPKPKTSQRLTKPTASAKKKIS